jgi:hypothetical protein
MLDRLAVAAGITVQEATFRPMASGAAPLLLSNLILPTRVSKEPESPASKSVAGTVKRVRKAPKALLRPRAGVPMECGSRSQGRLR